MKTIYKYDITNASIVNMPIGAQILSVQMQGNRIVLWAMIDQEELRRDYYFYIYGTGTPIPKDIFKSNYLATVQDGMDLVWHVFIKY